MSISIKTPSDSLFKFKFAEIDTFCELRRKQPASTEERPIRVEDFSERDREMNTEPSYFQMRPRISLRACVRLSVHPSDRRSVRG